MTKFVKSEFVNSSGYVTYNGEFILRDKYAKDVTGKINFLVKNFEVEEYLSRLKAGEMPLPILESKGYLLPHIKKWLKQAGYPVTLEGFRKKIQDDIKKREEEAKNPKPPVYFVLNIVD